MGGGQGEGGEDGCSIMHCGFLRNVTLLKRKHKRSFVLLRKKSGSVCGQLLLTSPIPQSEAGNALLHEVAQRRAATSGDGNKQGFVCSLVALTELLP